MSHRSERLFSALSYFPKVLLIDLLEESVSLLSPL